ncbi:hypothetical protein FPV67DRAFT_1783446 [Lyophyllum atratum]|nr:hypothetical protein FPV67DRAFT_1783446 [Lyophyllum atratum]
MAAPNVLASPTFSAVSSTSSFIMLSSNTTPHESSGSSDDSDDEIVYSISEGSFLSSSGSSASDPASDDDFVVLPRPRQPRTVLETGLSTPNAGDDSDRAQTPSLASLTADLQKLSVNDSAPGSRPKKAKKARKSVLVANDGAKRKPKKAAQPSAEEATASYPSPGPSPARPKRVSTPSTAITHKEQAVVKVESKKTKSRKKKATGLGARSVVDDASEIFSDYGDSDAGSPSMYEEAVGYITSFLSNPAARENSACRLTFLQALIIELGLASSSLPASLTSAKAFLKTRAFLNIKEYLAVREQGPAAVQRIMHPSRNALIKDIKKNKNKASLRWVKDSGFQVLLVQCYH